MTVLVTGATGLIGAHVVRLLCKQGLTPRLLVRSQSDRRGLEGLRYQSARGDLLDPASLVAALHGVTRVVHCAGSVRLESAADEELQRVNVEGTHNILEAARSAGVKRFLHVSSVAAIGLGSRDRPATEDEAPLGVNPDPYSRSKRQGERLALQAASARFEVVVVNPGFVVGACDVRPTSGKLLLAIASGGLRVYPSGGINVVNAEDVACGIGLALEQGRSGERYILGGENLTYREFFTICAEECGVPPPTVPLPDLLLRSVAEGIDRVTPLLPGWFQHLDANSLRHATMTSYQSSAKAQRELGYVPHPVRLGIRAAYAWFQEHGVLPRERPLTPHGVLPRSNEVSAWSP